MKIAAVEAKIAYEAKLEEERRVAEEAERIAREKAEAEAAAAAQAEAEAAQQAEKELLASLIFCEAGNQPYEGQVAVGAVVMNRIKSSSYPDTMEEVIYQSGQFSPAMSGWLDRVRANQGYTEAAMQAAEDALARNQSDWRLSVFQCRRLRNTDRRSLISLECPTPRI